MMNAKHHTKSFTSQACPSLARSKFRRLWAFSLVVFCVLSVVGAVLASTNKVYFAWPVGNDQSTCGGFWSACKSQAQAERRACELASYAQGSVYSVVHVTFPGVYSICAENVNTLPGPPTAPVGWSEFFILLGLACIIGYGAETLSYRMRQTKPGG